MSEATCGNDDEALMPLPDIASLIRAMKNKRKIRKRNADRRSVFLSAPAGAGRATRVPACADPPLRARSPVGVPPRLFLETSKRLRPASGQASWDAAAIPTLTARWALPTPACPSPVNAPHGLLVVAASMMPKAARVRVVTPPAGTALAPAFGSTSRRRPYRARFDSLNITEMVTYVNGIVTTFLRRCSPHERSDMRGGPRGLNAVPRMSLRSSGLRSLEFRRLTRIFNLRGEIPRWSAHVETRDFHDFRILGR